VTDPTELPVDSGRVPVDHRRHGAGV